MKRLILMRHAKSDWGTGLVDHARPLNARGRRAATAIGGWLRAEGYRPGGVLCSSAARTRETLDRLRLDAETRFEPALYHAAPETMLSVLQGAAAPVVLMLGHNPGIGALAEALVDKPPAHPRFHAYPTCATLIADFDVADWGEVRPGAGRVAAFIVPRDLTD